MSGRPASSWEAIVLGAAPWLLAAFMIGSAVLHVRHAEFVMLLMPSWMPARLFSTYFAAVALAAGGVGLLVPRTRVLAGLLTGAMIGSWFVLVHTPRMLAEPTGPVGWSEMAESLGFATMAGLLAARAAGQRPGPAASSSWGAADDREVRRAGVDLARLPDRVQHRLGMGIGHAQKRGRGAVGLKP